MSPTLARASVIVLSVVVLALSALVTTLVWSLLPSLDPLPRGMVALVTWVSAYYVGANLILWKAVVRISSTPLSAQN